MARLKVLIRLLAAFLRGWVFPFLDAIDHVIDALARTYFQGSWSITIRTVGLPLFVLFPLSLGVAAAFCVRWRTTHRLPLALLIGQLAIAGFYGYSLPGASNPHFAFLWLSDALLVGVSSLVTSLVIRFAMTSGHKGFHESRQHIPQEEEP